MRVLPECRVSGVYHWQRTTPATDSLEINDADELFAKLPLGAASLEGELKRSGKLSVQTIVSGQLRLDGAAVTDVPREGPCAQATHIVSGAVAGRVRAQGGRQARRQRRRRASPRSAKPGSSANSRPTCCARPATSTAARPSTDREPARQLRVAHPGVPDAAARAAPRRKGPPGTVKVDFVSANAVQPLGRLRRRPGHLHDALRALRQRRAPGDAARARGGVHGRARQGAGANLLAHAGGARCSCRRTRPRAASWPPGSRSRRSRGWRVITGITLTCSAASPSDADGFCTRRPDHAGRHGRRCSRAASG